MGGADGGRIHIHCGTQTEAHSTGGFQGFFTLEVHFQSRLWFIHNRRGFVNNRQGYGRIFVTSSLKPAKHTDFPQSDQRHISLASRLPAAPESGPGAPEARKIVRNEAFGATVCA